MNCAVGQMKGLDSLGLWDDIDYVSSASGGSWAASIFTYYQSGAENDAQLLGRPYPPGSLNMALLNKAPDGFLGNVITCNFTEKIVEGLAKEALSLGTGLLEPADRIWIDAVGQCYLEPFGLYDPRDERYFTLDQASRDAILAVNPKLDSNDFYLVHSGPGEIDRPFLVMNSAFLAPAKFLPIDAPEPMAVLNYTPLYVGSANGMDVAYQSKVLGLQNFEIGGGFIEPFAFGSKTPKQGIQEENGKNIAKVKLPRRRYQLVDAVGTSSAAFASTVASSILLQLPTELLFGFTMDRAIPEEKYWPIIAGTAGEQVDFRFADGGSLENYGLITMLQRKVDRIVVFINTNSPIDPSFDPSAGIAPCSNTIDSDLYPLFGYPEGSQINNQVFPQAGFTEVFNQFVQAMENDSTVMAHYQDTTVANDWWGIPSGQAFDILFVYNESVGVWEEQLPDSVKEQLSLCGDGAFPDFPQYKLMFEDGFPRLVQLSQAQVNLLYQLQAWNVYSNPAHFSFLRNK